MQEFISMIKTMKFWGCIIGGCIIGFSIAYTFWVTNPNIPQNVQSVVNSSAVKSDEYRDVSQQLTFIMESLQNLKSEIDTKRLDGMKPVLVGLNYSELEKWEISAYADNNMKLAEGDKVYVINNFSEYKQSAVFTVRIMGEKSDKTNKAEFYLNRESAEYLGIHKWEERGIFEVNVEKVTK